MAHEFLEFEQGTPEWESWRHGGVGSSDATVISGAAVPWRSPRTIAQLWEEKRQKRLGGKTTWAQARGQRLEPVARRLYEQLTGNVAQPCCMQHLALPWLRASLDGMDEWGERIVEIKAPNEDSHRLALEDKVPEYYESQLLHQFLVSGVRTFHYVSITENDAFADDEKLAVVEWEVDASREREAWLLLAKESAFWASVQFNFPPDELREIYGIGTVEDGGGSEDGKGFTASHGWNAEPCSNQPAVH